MVPRHQAVTDDDRTALAEMVRRTSARQVIAALSDVVRALRDDFPRDGEQALLRRTATRLMATLDDAAFSQGVL